MNEDTILNVLIGFIITLSNILERVHSRKRLDRSFLFFFFLSLLNFTVTFFLSFPFFLSLSRVITTRREYTRVSTRTFED